MRVLLCLSLLSLAACNLGGPSLTVADLEAAKGEAHAMQPRDEAIAAVQEKLGVPPTRSDDNQAAWLGRDGDTCKELRVNSLAGMVGTVVIKKVDCR